MRIWDVDPGYLDRKRLLAEHQELHGLYNVVVLNKPRLANHPEPLRWKPHMSGLISRHQALVEEMTLRGYNHHSPLPGYSLQASWPNSYLNPPVQQFQILAHKLGHEQGRIPLPRNPQVLWAQHKYSVMARDPDLVSKIGSQLARNQLDLSALMGLLVPLLRQTPQPGRILNALDHMWGYVSEYGDRPADPTALLGLTRKLVYRHEVTYLLHSTALGELARFLI